MFYPISKLVVKNKGYNQTIKTLPQISIFKITKCIESNSIVEVTDDKGSIHLLIDIIFAAIVEEIGSPIRNMPHSTSLVFFETIVVYHQYKTEASTDHHF